jgi:hypothetical protein
MHHCPVAVAILAAAGAYTPAADRVGSRDIMTMQDSSALAPIKVPIPDCHAKVLPEEPCLNT